MEAAEILSGLPAQEREQLANSTAAYLTKQQGLRMVDLDPKKLSQQILDAIAQHAVSTPKPTYGGHTEKLAQAANMPSAPSIG